MECIYDVQCDVLEQKELKLEMQKILHMFTMLGHV